MPLAVDSVFDLRWQVFCGITASVTPCHLFKRVPLRRQGADGINTWSVRRATMLAYIHIGCEKTGTTSIQSFLDTNSQQMQNAGWALPRAGWFPNTTRLALSCMDSEKNDAAMAALERQTGWRDVLWQAIAEELAQSATGSANKLIVSSEYFQSKLDREHEIALLKRRFESAGVTRFRIIVYLRRQVEYAISRYSTALRAGYSRREILPQRLNEHSTLFNYEHLLQRWSAVFGSAAMDVRVFERSQLVKANVIDDFAQAAELSGDCSTWHRPARQNTALPVAAQVALRALNEALESSGVPRHDSRGLRRDVIERLATLSEGESLSASRCDAEQFQRLFAASNARVARRWFAREHLFDDVFDYPETASDLSAVDHVTSVFAQSVVGNLIPVTGKACRIGGWRKILKRQ